MTRFPESEWIYRHNRWKGLENYSTIHFHGCFSFGLIETLADHVRCWTWMFQIGKNCVFMFDMYSVYEQRWRGMWTKLLDQQLTIRPAFIVEFKFVFFLVSRTIPCFFHSKFQMKAIEISSFNALQWHISYVFRKVTIPSKPIKWNSASIAHDP